MYLDIFLSTYVSVNLGAPLMHVPEEQGWGRTLVAPILVSPNPDASGHIPGIFDSQLRLSWRKLEEVRERSQLHLTILV